MFQRVKGVADNFFDMPYWSGIQKRIQAHLQRHNFNQIDIPIIEHVSLFERGLGFETDVVEKQMFILQSKHDADSASSSDALCLRPEATAGSMRAFLAEQSNITLPKKVFCCGPMFRYERPQKGRLRQFHQFNMEMFGVDSILYDAQFLKIMYTLFLQELQMQDFVLKINFLGQSNERKIFGETFVKFLTAHESKLCSTCQKRLQTNPLRILDCKSVDCHAIFSQAPKIAEFFSQQTQNEWQLLQDTLHELGVTFIVDTNLVRGLDYYNKTVFEFVSVNLGAQNTFCGGGRYDGLAQQLGSKHEITAFGAAIGMERLAMILQDKKDFLSEKSLPLACIIPLTAQQNKLALHVADFLCSAHQTKQISVEVLLDDEKIKNKMKQAHDLRAAWAILLGDDEQNNNTATIKNMITGTQETVIQKDILSKL